MAVPAAGAGQVLTLRPQIIKPVHVQLQPYHRDDVIRVKFHDDSPVRLRDGAPTDLGTGVLTGAGDLLASVAGGEWRPLVDLPDATLEALRQTAQSNLGREIADFRVWFELVLPPGADAAAVIDALNALDSVELAEPVQMAAPPPNPPPFGDDQGYLNAGPVGLGALAVHEHFGTRGTGVKLIDIEFAYDAAHQDLPTVQQIIAPGAGVTQAEIDHGTASLGIVGALDNGLGMTGMAPDAQLAFAAIGGGLTIPNAIMQSVTGSHRRAT